MSTSLRSREYGNYRKPSYRPTFSGYIVTVDPVCLPVTLAEAKKTLRLTDTSQDDIIESMIYAATDEAEIYVGKEFIPRTFTQYLDYWPEFEIQLVAQPLQSVTSIKYLDEAGDQQTLAADQYVVDANRVPPIITRARDVSWPQLYGQTAQIEIEFIAGHTPHTGEAAGEITAGAQTSILTSDFDTDPGRKGLIYLENSNGEYETIVYSAVQEFSGAYTFIVNGTLSYTYPDASTVIAYSIPDVWRQGILSLVVDMFEHPEASSEILLYNNKTVQRLLNVGSVKTGF